ncbi:MAG TPA: SprT family zinc-dependent metalloprotease [Syntrophorhabdales bacterium]|nr:SprT family zinc-dependent metalloprotease [Syntrophorhabdales bacterium]
MKGHKDQQTSRGPSEQAAGACGYLLVRSSRRRKTMTLRIDRLGRVVIRAPLYTVKKEVDRFFEQNRAWVRRKLAERYTLQKMCKPKSFVPGEEFLFLGKSYPLRLGETNGGIPSISFCSRGFTLPENHTSKARCLFITWYKTKAWEKITERVLHYSRQLNLIPQEIRLMTARTQWGSCSPDNRLSFNWKLVMAADTFIDYVVVHELLHIREKNHSLRFWEALKSLMPDYKERKAWLDENGHLLNI